MIFNILVAVNFLFRLNKARKETKFSTRKRFRSLMSQFDVYF